MVVVSAEKFKAEKKRRTTIKKMIKVVTKYRKDCEIDMSAAGKNWLTWEEVSS